MHLHILGICGTFMGGIAALAKQAGHTVTGCDANVYPPMSTQLEAQGIALTEGYDPKQIRIKPDVFVIGNVVSRGNPLMEEILNRGLPYISGPQWLAEHILNPSPALPAPAALPPLSVGKIPLAGTEKKPVSVGMKWTLAVAGTHGKTTTSAMLAWILEDAGLNPGFLIGGVPQNFGVSARLTDSPFFVVEADEYDTAFFDKRSKFVHYRPRTAVLNNLEFDHADIFPDLHAIETQFHHLVRTVPGNGLIVANGREDSLQRVLARGCWTPVETFGSAQGWTIGGGEMVAFKEEYQGTLHWELLGEHNRMNALAAIAAARHAGVPAQMGIEALARFRNVKRRMEVRGNVNGITVYDDFAHHPTAIATTLGGLRRKVGAADHPRTGIQNASQPGAGVPPTSGVASMPNGMEPALPSGGRILAVLEPRSNTMKLGVMKDALPGSLTDADQVFCYGANLGWDAAAALQPLGSKAVVHDDLAQLVAAIAAAARPGDHILVMSNGGFGGVHEKLLAALALAARTVSCEDGAVQENHDERQTASTTRSAPEPVAGESRRRGEPAGSISPAGAEIHPEFDGIGRRARQPGAASEAVASTRPLDATRDLATTAGLIAYSEVAERLAVNIAHYLDALLKNPPEDIRITPEWICDTHRCIAGALFPEWAGCFRATDVQVGTHMPPPGHEVAVHVKNFSLDLEERQRHLHGAKSIADLLAWVDWRFQWIHPFKDFNGRVGRILLIALAYKFALPPIDPAAADEPGKIAYFAALRAADAGDLAELNDLWLNRLLQSGATHENDA